MDFDCFDAECQEVGISFCIINVKIHRKPNYDVPVSCCKLKRLFIPSVKRSVSFYKELHRHSIMVHSVGKRVYFIHYWILKSAEQLSGSQALDDSVFEFLNQNACNAHKINRRRTVTE
ncbi:hypothetical protein CI610_03227 [invertebrate metagenome]|uniref:Uncharacterized protein n=1 Tax=invertebrate metagenome TaxID=1711999 RepID=A0A2H9T3T0_9ZZZZ